jgi:hypothetical protein
MPAELDRAGAPSFRDRQAPAYPQPWEALMPATLPCARFTDQELALRKQARSGVRPTLPNPAATARALRWPSAKSRPGCDWPARSSGSATGPCGRRSPTESSASAVHRSAPPASSGSRSKSPRRDWWMRSRSSAGASGSCSSPCGWRRYRATGSSSNSSTNSAVADRRGEPTHRLAGYPQPTARGLASVGAGHYRPSMASGLHLPPARPARRSSG